MKKIYFSLMLSLAGLYSNAQTLTATNHSPVAGNMYATYQCDSVNPGASGTGVTWNFASINTHSSIVNNYTVAANTNTAYPLTGLAIASNINNISYYTSSSNDLKYWGGNITVGAISATLVYSLAAVSATYPMSIGTTTNSSIGGNISIPAASQTGTFNGTSNATADGTGTLILPNGTFTNIIRVVTSQTINFTVPLTAGTVTQKNYDYYDLSKKEALFTISTSSIVSALGSSTQTIVTRSSPSTAGIKENKKALINVLVYPNPASNNLNFVTESTEAKSLLIYNLTGSLLEKQNLTDGKLKLDVSNYTAGVYLYTVIGKENQTLKTGKITVSH